ncbi:MAG: hypothetical protein QOD49_737, partial [Actinomycetota bacterium]|nr:hypothetical protein [Actinomycetota bacterium]
MVAPGRSWYHGKKGRLGQNQ